MANANDSRAVSVYRSPREEGLYLYVAREEALQRVPEDLLKHFGQPVEALQLQLAPDRKLARAKATEVLAAIADKGFYLQLPPSTHQPETLT